MTARTPADARHAHDRAALALLGAAAALGAVAAAPSVPVQAALLVLAVAALGLPHGGLDGAEGRRLLAPRLGRLWLPAFLGAYLGLAAIVLTGWAMAPLGALAAFLLVAAIHFGAGDADPAGRLPAAEIAFRGALPIALPVIFHPEETGAIFALLTGEHTLPAALPALSLPLAALLALLALPALASHPRPRALCLEAAALAAIFALWPPLVAFALYFVLLHAPRHMLAHDPGRAGEPLWRPLTRLTRRSAPWTLGAAALAAAGFAAIGGLAEPATAAIRTVFWGLSALALPHILLDLAASRADALRRPPHHEPRQTSRATPAR